MKKATLYLIPIPITDGALQTLSGEISMHTLHLTHYFAENARTARRFLKALHPAIVMESLHISEINKHDGADTVLFKEWLQAGIDVGIMSEAGCPGIADPGADLVRMAHGMGATVVPLTGPNSLILALMASGLNGQSFSFQGYLPVKEPLRGQRIKALEQLSQKEKQTQLFIETPYRNNNLLNDLLKNCQDKTNICIAMNLTSPNAYIKTLPVSEWKKDIPELGKAPAVFLMLA